MQLTDWQNVVASDTHRFRVLNCGRRAGKTQLCVEEMKGMAVSRECRIAYISPNYNQSRDICWALLKKQMEPVVVSANEARLELTVRNVKGTTSMLLLRGWEAVESLRGQSFDFLVIDEVASMRNFHSGWEEVIRPTLTDRKGAVLFCSTPKGFNHFYDLYIKEASDTDYKSFHFTTYDNPHIPPEEIDKAKIEMTEDRFAQEYLADFRKTSGLVYKEFDRERHIYDPEKEKPTSVADRLCGVDFGYTNPAGILLIEKDTDGVYWVTQEFYEKEKSTAEIIEIAASFNARKYYPDPAEPDRIREMKNYGLNVRDVSKDKVAGINLVREMFKCNRIKVSSHCLNFIWELETYHYPENRQDKNENEEPVKKDDHLCLSGDTKILMANGKQKKLKYIKPHRDRVQTSNGPELVVDWALTERKADVYEIELSNGTKLVGTGNHPIMTGRGMVPLDALRYGEESDIIETWNQSSIKELDITGTENIIHQSEAVLMAMLGYTKQSGKMQMEKYQEDLIFTIKTAVGQTMNSLIWKLRKCHSILETIQERGGLTKNTEKKVLSTLKKLGNLLKSGTHLPRELLGIENMEKNVGKIKDAFQKTVKFVEKLTQLSFPTEQDFVIKIVKRRLLGKEDVYNITVENTHNYYANGILVSNCDCLRYIVYMQESGKKGRIAKTFYPSGLSKKFTPQVTPNKDKGETFTHYPKFKR